MKEYAYKELCKKALENPSQENLTTLADWFWGYGNEYWNGEGWKIDKDKYLVPIYSEEPDNHGCYKILGYKIV